MGYLRIDGSTALEDREAAIQQFNAPGSSVFIFLLSIRSDSWASFNKQSHILFGADYRGLPLDANESTTSKTIVNTQSEQDIVIGGSMCLLSVAPKCLAMGRPCWPVDGYQDLLQPSLLCKSFCRCQGYSNKLMSAGQLVEG